MGDGVDAVSKERDRWLPIHRDPLFDRETRDRPCPECEGVGTVSFYDDEDEEHIEECPHCAGMKTV